MDNYSVNTDDPVNSRTLAPAESLRVAQATGEIAEKFTPETVRFRDASGRIRPVSPFLELWAQLEPEGDLLPLTVEHLKMIGLGNQDIQWRVQVGNIKAFRRTDQPNDKIEADTGWFSDHIRHPLQGRCLNFLVDKTLPLGSVQYLQPTLEFPEIRLRFTPARGLVYGPKRVNNLPDPNLAAVVYDRTKGTWPGYTELNTGTPLTVTNPGAIYYGEPTPPNEPPGWRSFGYLDDECDGIIEARLEWKDDSGNPSVLSAFARIAVGPPTFAPDGFPVRTVADELEQALLGPTVEGQTPRAEIVDIVRRALESVRLMNTDYMNRGSLQRGVGGMARMDTADTTRALEPIMDPSVVDALAMRARHERVLLSLQSGTLAWFAYILRQYDEIGDLSDDGRRKMPAMMRGADGRHLALTRRQVAKVKSVAPPGGGSHTMPITLQSLPTHNDDTTGGQA